MNPEQRQALIRAVVERRDYFVALKKRMEQQGWYTCDAVYLSVVAAASAAHAAVAAIVLAERLPPPAPPPRDASDRSPFTGRSA